jgi:hypothetical protein
MSRFFLFIFILLLTPLASWAQRDLCDVLKIPNCSSVMRQVRRSSAQSYPSPGTAASTNPANVSFDRGLGVELIYQPGNNVNFNLASGTGKVGGALISSATENGFFGNRNIETDFSYMTRNDDQKQYRSKKLNLALGGRVLGKRNYTLDFGLLIKRHNDIKNVNLGYGASAKLGIFSFGAALYQDDFIIYQKDAITYSSGRNYDIIFNSAPSYSEKFQVRTFSGGFRYKDFSFDAGFINVRYKVFPLESRIQILSASYAYKNLMFNIARRVENSPMVKYINGDLKYQQEMTNYYMGIQTSVGKHLIVGTAYNYFLLREISLNATFFF